MKWFRSRSEAEEFAEAIRPELRSLAVPEPGVELMQRIIASRASGTRIILPDVSDGKSISRRSVLIPISVVAALLLIALPFRLSPPREPARSEPSSIARLASEWLPGSVALAQSDASRTIRRFAPMTMSRPSSLHPMRLEYLRTWRDSANREVGRVTGFLTVDRTATPGGPAWLVVARNQGTQNGRAVLAIDSTLIARENLKLISHTAIERPYSRYDVIRIDQKFRGDSIVGNMHANGSRMSPAYRLISRKLNAANGPYIIDPLAPIILGTVNLHSEWTGRASLIGWAVRDEDVFIPIDLRVDGAEKIKVPAGEFDCWRLTVSFEGRSLTYWVRRSDGIAVQSIERNAAGVTRETRLIKF